MQLLRDGDVLVDGLARAALAGVEVGELAADLEIAGVDLGHLLEDVPGLARLAPLDVLVDDDLVVALGLHHEALLGVEVGQAEVRLGGRGVELVDLAPDRDGLQEEAVPGVEVRDLRVLLARLPDLVHLGVEVADLVDGVPVAGVVLHDLAVEDDGLVEPAPLLELVRVLLDLDGVDLGHSPSSAQQNSHRWVPWKDRRWISEGPIRLIASR